MLMSRFRPHPAASTCSNDQEGLCQASLRDAPSAKASNSTALRVQRDNTAIWQTTLCLENITVSANLLEMRMPVEHRMIGNIITGSDRISTGMT